MKWKVTTLEDGRQRHYAETSFARAHIHDWLNEKVTWWISKSSDGNFITGGRALSADEARQVIEIFLERLQKDFSESIINRRMRQ